jgi:hypothetical protein
MQKMAGGAPAPANWDRRQHDERGQMWHFSITMCVQPRAATAPYSVIRGCCVFAMRTEAASQHGLMGVDSCLTAYGQRDWIAAVQVEQRALRTAAEATSQLSKADLVGDPLKVVAI